MREINVFDLKTKIVKGLSHIGYNTDQCVKETFIKCAKNEENEIAKDILLHLAENIEIASQGNFPLCQDTGLVIFWVKQGENVQVTGLEKALNEAVIEAFSINNFRHSVVNDPIYRVNTKNNIPPIIHYETVQGDKFQIDIMLKGGGSENMSALKMLKPSDGITGIREFVIQTVKNAGGNACPPLFVGVGIGGNFETCAILAKKALLPKVKCNSEELISEWKPKTGCTHLPASVDKFWLKEEAYLLSEINKLDIGPMGMGGKTTAISVKIQVAPCHIASLPVAVNLECHAHRVMSYEL